MNRSCLAIRNLNWLYIAGTFLYSLLNAFWNLCTFSSQMMDLVQMQTLSLGNWMELPDLPFNDWLIAYKK